MADDIIGAGGGEQKMASLSPNGRLGQPEDVAAVVVYLASRASGHVNGDTIMLDGGKLLAGSVL